MIKLDTSPIPSFVLGCLLLVALSGFQVNVQNALTDCIQPLQAEFDWHGNIVIADSHTLGILSPDDFVYEELTIENDVTLSGRITLSPDGRYLAANLTSTEDSSSAGTGNQVGIFSLHGDLETSWPLEDRQLGDWHDTETLIISSRNTELTTGQLTSALLDIDTGEIRNLIASDHNYPPISTEMAAFWLSWREVYSSDDRYAFYRATSLEGATRVVIIDLLNDEVIWSKDDNGPLLNLPEWNPVSDTIAYVINSVQDTTSINTTLFLKSADDGELQISDVSHFGGSNWSPDGHHIAFWSSTDEAQYLVILTLTSSMSLGVEDILCYELTISSQIPSAIIWSPDSAMVGYVEWISGTNHINLIDLQSNQTTELSIDHFELIGWAS